MNSGVTEEVGKVAGGFVSSLKDQPLSLALVVMNLAMLVFFYFLLSTVASQREREVTQLHQEQKDVREMLGKCIVPERDRRGDLTWPPSLGEALK